MGKTVKCIISKYDENITQPPFKTIKIAEVDVQKPDDDKLGVAFAWNLRKACMRITGEDMQFYTTSSVEGYDYEIVVYSESFQLKMLKKEMESFGGKK